MSRRLPRRPPPVQPPLRGRSAAPPPGQTPSFMPVVRQRPPRASHSTKCEDINRDCLALCSRCPRLFKVLNRPWKWLVVLLVLMGLSFLLGTLF